ncbi:hypothetical protein SVAN01_04454 [Stagonosporopsis vannaccii]|nr:hypothetical protein SVAN01_04454 [Stagonosporopsis vannaccii]
MGVATTRSANNLHSLAGNCCQTCRGALANHCTALQVPRDAIVGPKIVGS